MAIAEYLDSDLAIKMRIQQIDSRCQYLCVLADKNVGNNTGILKIHDQLMDERDELVERLNELQK